MIKKIAEFNFKLLHNIVSCGYSISKFNRDISPQGTYTISWKELVCGFTAPVKSKYVDSLQMLNSYIIQCESKQNAKSKFEMKGYGRINMQKEVMTYVEYVNQVLDNTSYDKKYKYIFEKVISVL